MGADERRYVPQPAADLHHPQPLLAGCGLAVADSLSAGLPGAAGRRAAVLARGAIGRIAAGTDEGITHSGGRAGADGGVGLGLAAGGGSSGVAGAGCQQMAAVAGYAADGGLSALAPADRCRRLVKSRLVRCASCRADAAAARR